MKTKKLPQEPKAKAMIGELSVKAEGKDLYIEGWANKAVVDRGGDLIPPEAWDVNEFKKNPIIFFNHDRNMPIGKATRVEVTKDGLRIKVKLSSSDEGPMPYIRDLVKEGILKAFSVGFDPMDSEEAQKDGTVVIRKAKLLETSVVTLPMNQESYFDVAATEKALEAIGECSAAVLKCKSLDEARAVVTKALAPAAAPATEEKHDGVAQPITSSNPDPTDFGSPAIDLQKGQLALLGSLVTLMGEMLKELRGVNSKMDNAFSVKAATPETPPPAPAPAPTPPPAPTPTPEEAAKAAHAEWLAKMNKKVQNFQEALAKLKG